VGSTTAAASVVTPFGGRLRDWRRARNLSQLQLALAAGSTSRHVSFLETGRSRPSRAMVLRLAEVLDLSLRDQNDLLQVAGFSPAYSDAGLDAAELTPFRRVIDNLLAAHEPFPALVLDGYGNVLAANGACGTLFGPDLVGGNMVERVFGNPATPDVVVNWSDVAWAGVDGLRRQLQQSPWDDRLRQLVEVAELAVRGLSRPTGDDAHGLVACPWFRVGDEMVRTMVLAGRFDGAVDITLDQLRIELVYPLDAAAERFFRAHAVGADRAGEAGVT
jgi:transcriptional regulator with XRE-family HTH domain